MPDAAPQPTREKPTPLAASVGEVVLSTAGNRPVYWIPNPGNAGDALISAGTVSLFRAHGIDFHPVASPKAFDSTGKIVCYGGGGNFVPLYRNARDNAARLHARAEHFFILPHTIDGNENLLGAFGPNVSIFCREAVSYGHCLAAAPNARVLAAHDLAFSMSLSSLMRPPVTRAGAAAPAGEYETARRKFLEFLAEAGTQEELSVFRADKEANSTHVHAPTVDISILYMPEPESLQSHLVASHFFLCTVDAFARVRTDRLHVAIAGALLGKQVTLYANSYYKNRAVYDFSLRRFPNMEFVE